VLPESPKSEEGLPEIEPLFEGLKEEEEEVKESEEKTEQESQK